MNKAKYLLLLTLLSCGNNKTCLPFEPLIPEAVVTQGEIEPVMEAVETITVEENEPGTGSGAITFQ